MAKGNGNTIAIDATNQAMVSTMPLPSLVASSLNATAAATYNVSIEFEGSTHSFSCRSDQTVLAAAEEAGVMLPSSCCSGVCTDCASMLLEGSVDQEDAMGLNDDLREKGFALLCVAYPKSDLNIVIGKEVEDDLYNDQFGK